MPKLRRRITSSQRLQVLERDEYLCQYCGDDATEVDHIIPWSFCLKDDLNNLVASCKLCNAYAGSCIFDSFQDKKAYILGQRHRRELRRVFIGASRLRCGYDCDASSWCLKYNRCYSKQFLPQDEF